MFGKFATWAAGVFTSAFLRQITDAVLELLKIRRDAATNKELGRSEAAIETQAVVGTTADEQAHNNAKVRTVAGVADRLRRGADPSGL